jgi:hypothetical protein
LNAGFTLVGAVPETAVSLQQASAPNTITVSKKHISAHAVIFIIWPANMTGFIRCGQNRIRPFSKASLPTASRLLGERHCYKT